MCKTKFIIVSKYAPSRCKRVLSDMGYIVVEGTALRDVPESISHHPDMQLFRLSDGKWLCAPEVFDYYKKYFDKYGVPLIPGENNPGAKYPDDVLYNIAIIGKYAIHNFKYTDKRFFENSEYIQINIAQGYSKCSLCVVSEDAAITSDCGIAACLAKNGLDVLQISEGGIRLPGYSCGFIGGASGLTEDGKLVFCGNIKKHKDYEKIDAFCKNRNVSIVSIPDFELVDIGTIIAVG